MSSWNKCVLYCDQCGEVYDQNGECDCDRTRHKLYLAYGGMFLFAVGFGIAVWSVFSFVFIEPQEVFYAN